MECVVTTFLEHNSRGHFNVAEVFASQISAMVRLLRLCVAPVLRLEHEQHTTLRTGIASTEAKPTSRSTAFGAPSSAGARFRSKEEFVQMLSKRLQYAREIHHISTFETSIRRKNCGTELITKIYMLYFLSAVYVPETQYCQATVVAHSLSLLSLVFAFRVCVSAWPLQTAMMEDFL